MKRPRLKNGSQINLDSFVLTMDQPKEEYKKPDTLCKITVENIRETRARRIANKFIPIFLSEARKIAGPRRILENLNYDF